MSRIKGAGMCRGTVQSQTCGNMYGYEPDPGRMYAHPVPGMYTSSSFFHPATSHDGGGGLATVPRCGTKEIRTSVVSIGVCT